MAANPSLLIQTYDGIILAEVLAERVLDAPVINAIGADLLAQMDRHARPSLVLDIGKVGYISSAMIGKLVAVSKRITAHRGRMAICGAKPTLMPIFKMVQLDKLVPFHPEAEKILLEWRRKPL